MNRKELYKLIWSKPISHIAKEIDRSESDIKKACLKFNIPTPPNGHWSKLQFGKESPQTPLPALVDEALKQLADLFEEKQTETSPLKRLNLKREEIEKDKSLILKVPDRITTLDKIVEKAKQDLTLAYSKRTYQHDDFEYTSNNAFSITVSKEAISRAVRIVNTLVVVLQKRGHSFKFGHETEVVIYNEPIQIRLREKREKYIKEVHSSGYHSYAYKPTGILYFIIDRWSPEKIYSDSVKVKLENRISQIIAYLEILAEKKVQERIKSQIWHKEYEQKRLEEENKRKLIEAENIKIQHLIQDSENWRKANNLRAYINAIEQNKSTNLSQGTIEYIIWARAIADKIDPLMIS